LEKSLCVGWQGDSVTDSQLSRQPAASKKWATPTSKWDAFQRPAGSQDGSKEEEKDQLSGPLLVQNGPDANHWMSGIACKDTRIVFKCALLMASNTHSGASDLESEACIGSDTLRQRGHRHKS
jgi:hypothetical protein